MHTLGIETSCDETAVSVLWNTEVLSSEVYSQIETHKVFGGVVPEVAAREHLKILPELVQAALGAAQREMTDIDLIAVTQGPGLVGALLVGCAYAKGLAVALRKPLMPVNHVHAHLHGALLGLDKPLSYPCLGLVASGGHTHLYLMSDPVSFELVAQSMDDACGECFDKVAKVFGLGYPGGPLVEKAAQGGDPGVFATPRMVEQRDKLAFSYSGLKTYMVNLHRRELVVDDDSKLGDMLAAFQEEALGQLVRKLASALHRYPETASILVAGGVAANKRFRSLVQKSLRVPAHFPDLRYCSDNAAMIAHLGYHHWQASGGQVPVPESWDCFSRYRDGIE